jgi:hypothetical protein
VNGLRVRTAGAEEIVRPRRLIYRDFCVSVILASLVALGACVAGNRAQAIQSSADTDSYRVWIALLKGFEGDVRYVGSDEQYAYFRIGTIFRSYHKLPLCAVQLPETLSLDDGRAYVVRFHVDADNTIPMKGTCSHYEGRVLGQLDRVK